MSRVLHPAGRLVALFSHPCFDIPGASGWVAERLGPDTTVWRKLRRYAEPSTGHFHWRVDGRLCHTVAYHRPLSWYVRRLRSAGLVVTALEEPAPTEEFSAEEPEAVWMAEVPLHILLEARKARVALSEPGD